MEGADNEPFTEAARRQPNCDLRTATHAGFPRLGEDDPALREQALREVFTEMWENGVITSVTDPKDMRGLIHRFLKGQ